MQPILQVSHLSKNFGDFKAVSDLSFDVYEGDIYGFLGQNGAGKSTTIRMILSLVKPSGGDILFKGKSVVGTDKSWLKDCGAIIERPDLYKYLSAFDNLRIFARMSGKSISKKQIIDQLEMVGLAERASSKVKTFSQGMKQRMGIAIALVHNPGLVILDEPTNGLDPQGIADMRELIISLREQHNKTVIISSHLLNEIEQVATRMLIINKGKKIIEGKVTDLINPENSIVELETVDNNEAYGILQTSAWAASTTLEEDILKIKLNKAEVPQVLALLQSADIPVFSAIPRHSLEDYFLQVTKTEA